MEKQLNRFFNLRINARSAAFENLNIGPNLSTYMKKDSIKDFCEAFNKETSIYRSEDLLIYVRLFLYTDKSFIFLIKGPSFGSIMKLILNVSNLSQINYNNINLTLKDLYFMVWLRNYFWLKIYKNLDEKWVKLRFKNSFFSLYNLKITTFLNNN